VSDDGVEHEHDEEAMRFWINSRGPDDTIVTSYVVGLEKLRRTVRRSAIFTGVILVLVVFCLALSSGTYHMLWLVAVVNGLMVVGAVVSGVLTGSIWGEYRMLERIGRARVSVQVHDIEEPGDDD